MISLLFPHVCYACGHATVNPGQLLCVYCLPNGLQPAVEDPAVILPDGIVRRISAWQFDKNGLIQVLLHGLKYNHMPRLGFEMGFEAARLHALPPMLIVPVPLHPARLRKRGYNQAKAIAEGVAAATGGEVLGDEALIRTRNTRTQTGFALDQRKENIRSAFVCVEPERLRGRDLLLVDDVFTTGATLFELYETIRHAAPASVSILTLAQA